MSEDKIDKLFQEKLKGFSEVPDPKVWQSIEASLDQKKKSRKGIPFWWKFGAAAAVLLIAFIVIKPFSESNSTIVTDVQNLPEKSIDKNKTKPSQIKIIDSIPLVQQPLVNSNKAGITHKKKQLTTKNTSSKPGKNLITKTHHKSSLPSAIASTTNTKPIEGKELSEKFSEKPSSTETTQQTIVANSKNKTSQQTNSTYEQGLKPSKKEKIVLEKKKKSLLEEIEAQNEDNKELVSQNVDNKWSAGPSIAPVYFNAIGMGSSVDPNFIANSRSGNVTLSYGLSIAYELTSKLSIRSGVHKVDFGYNTNDVLFSSSTDDSYSNQLNTIDYVDSAQGILVESSVSLYDAAYTNENSFAQGSASDVNNENTSSTGVIQQQFSYLEVPVELSYALLDKRFELKLIGGVSSLFVLDNLVSLKSNEQTTTLGEANNLQSLNFSTNIGFGLNYNFSPKVKLSLEPVFKYQINTFSSIDGSFQPFSIGIYSGFRFKF